MKILDCEEITWRTWRPFATGDFPCTICRREIATIRITTKGNGVTVKREVCNECKHRIERGEEVG